MDAELKLELLGGLTLTLDGAPLTGLRYSKAQALLAYLAVTGRPHSREALAGLLWSELPEADARNNLRVTLASLRQGLRPYLLIEQNTVAFNWGSRYTLDVTTFLDKLSGLGTEADIAELHEAAELYRGELLEGFSVQDAPLFDEWLAEQRERLQHLAVQALHTLAVYHTEKREYTAGIDYLTRLLALDPWREDAHRHLMRLLAKSGQRDAALSQYHHLRRTLKSEFGLEPSAETVMLYEQLRAGEVGGKHQLLAESLGLSKVHNLPVPTSPFVEREVTEDIVKLLGDSRCRLLTLVGPGGVGKTRLAAEVATRRTASFTHEAWYISLASLTLAEGLAPSIANSLGVPLSGAAEASEGLLSYLRSRELLLVLDNFEHLLNGAPFLSRILQEAPGVKLLVTSRERLNVQGEWMLPIGGMSYPQARETQRTSGLADYMERYSALRLFRQSAQRAKPGFSFNDADIRMAAEICELVGAVPLAIELAAAWVRTLSLREISQEIARDPDFLAAPKDVPERHGSIRAVFEHSWNLLSSEEQDVLKRSSVFRGGFTREAALEVAGASVPVLSALVDKSLLYRDADGRYWRHVLIKSFVDEKAAAQPEEAARMEERHSAYYLDFLLRHELSLRGRKQREALSEIEADMDNVRAAWVWAVDHGREEALGRVLPSLETIYAMQGRFQEGKASFALAASKLPAESLIYGRALVRQGIFQILLGHYEKAKALLQKSMALFERHDAPEDVAFTLQHLGRTIYQQGAYAEAKPYMLESLALYQKLGDPVGIADNLNNLGIVAEVLGEYEQARHHHWEALALRREIGDYRAVAVSLVNLGDVAYRAGQVGEAGAFYEESLTLRREIGDSGRIMSSLARLGDVSLVLGDAEKAERYYREALQLSLLIHALPRIMQSLLGMATVLVQARRGEEALTLLDVIKHHPATPRWYRDDADRLFSELAAELSPQKVAAAKAKGAARDVLELAEGVLRSGKAIASR